MDYTWAEEQLVRFQKQKPERRQRMKRRLRKAKTGADNVPGAAIVNSFYCLGIKKKITQIKSSHAIDVGFQFLQVDWILFSLNPVDFPRRLETPFSALQNFPTCKCFAKRLPCILATNNSKERADATIGTESRV